LKEIKKKITDSEEKNMEVTICRHWVLGSGQNIAVKMSTILSDM
jgi:hypothetical protein